MKFWYKLERKIGRFAIHHLMKYIIGAYIIGYLFALFKPEVLSILTLEPYFIMHGQVWRIITWIMVPDSSFTLLTAVVLFFYYQLGNQLEYYWGTFRFNLYMFGGWFFTLIGAFVLYIILVQLTGVTTISMGGLFSTYYINMSLFLAFATCFPNMEVRLYFILPIKMKWMGLLYAAMVIYSFIHNGWVGRTAIIASLLNFIIFFIATRNWKAHSPKEVKRRAEYKKKVEVKPDATRHKCAICGRTEKDDPTLEFRYCSKCDGNFEYCQEHLFTHEHVKRS